MPIVVRVIFSLFLCGVLFFVVVDSSFSSVVQTTKKNFLFLLVIYYCLCLVTHEDQLGKQTLNLKSHRQCSVVTIVVPGKISFIVSMPRILRSTAQHVFILAYVSR